MKLARTWVGAALGVALLASCTGLAPVPQSPPPDNVALEARLAGLDERLEDLERVVATEREARRAQSATNERALNEIQRELKATKVAMAGLRRTVQSPLALKKRQDLVTTSRDVPNANYRPIDVALGELPSGNDERVIRPIPAAIPSSVREILIYAQVATGYVKGGPHRFRIATRLDNGQEAAFHLYAVGQPQQGWAYNSDNVWLPMPANRELILQAEGEPFFGDWNSEVRIIGYR